ncbi:MAG: site-2 protease family protein [Methanomassiliicoccaceae archaeon]|jgi:membrane-associated protease RseP (regulator of RpoE activity)|nr:site-2 protease family protein [Methanomassiliicoccaceae archaeon]
MGVIDTLIGNTTYLVLLILLIVYIPIYFHVRSSKRMKERGIVPYGPTIMLKTARGIRFLDNLAKYKRFWAFFGTVSKIMAFFLMIMIMSILVIDIFLLPSMMGTKGIGIEYALAIPGLNPMLPIVYGIIGLVVAVGIHELAHGIQSRANDMKVESVGVLYAVVPIGAFVEPNEEQIRTASRKARSTMFAAGIAINLTVAIVLFLVMSLGIMGAMSSNAGDRAAVMNISSSSPAFDSGIGPSSLIIEIDTGSGLKAAYYSFDDEMFYSDAEMKKPIEFSFGASYDNAYAIHYAVKEGMVDDRFPKIYMGLFIEGISNGSPAEKAGIEAKSFIISIDDVNITSVGKFKEVMNSKTPGQSVEIVVGNYKGNDVPLENVRKENIVLSNNNGKAFLGVTYTFSGFNLSTPDAELAIRKNPFHNVSSVQDAAKSALSYIGMPFRGYSPIHYDTAWWYQSSFMSSDMSWVVLQTIYWIFWLNLVLAVTNALPAVPFDGGYLFRDGIGSIVDRVRKNDPEEKREQTTNIITNVTSYAVLFILILVMVVVII